MNSHKSSYTGAFMFKSLVSRSSKPKKKRPKRPPRKVKSNKKISTRATDYLRTKGLTDVDRKKIKQQQRGHVMVAKLAAKSRRRMNRQKTSPAKQSRSAPYVVVYPLTYSNNSNSNSTHTQFGKEDCSLNTTQTESTCSSDSSKSKFTISTSGSCETEHTETENQ